MRKYTTKKTLADTITERNAAAKAKAPTLNTNNIPKIESSSPRLEEIKNLLTPNNLSKFFASSFDFVLVPKSSIQMAKEHLNKGDKESAILFLNNAFNWIKVNTSYEPILEDLIQDCLDLSFKDFLDTPLEEREKHPHMKVLKLILNAQAARELVSFYPMPPPMIEEDINKIFNPYAFERELIAKAHYSLIPDKKVSPKQHYAWVRKFRTLGRKLHLEGYKALELPSDCTVSGNTELVYLDNERLDEPRVTL